MKLLRYDHSGAPELGVLRGDRIISLAPLTGEYPTIPDPHTLGLRCFVNGEKRQDGNTSELVYDVWDQIAYLSTALTLDPGDLLATGTPDGVGVAMKPPMFLQPGDVVRCEVDGIGAIENRVAAPSA